MRRADRIVYAGALDAGAVRAAPGRRGVPRLDAGPDQRGTVRLHVWLARSTRPFASFTHRSTSRISTARSRSTASCSGRSRPRSDRDYAKFDLAEPPLVLSLIPGRPGAGGNLNHVGLRVRNAGELVEIQARLEAAGLHTEREEGVECCYARQTKFWITDPDRALLGDLRLSRRHRRSRQRRASSRGAASDGDHEVVRAARVGTSPAGSDSRPDSARRQLAP